jgi:putative endonuclease
MSNLRRIGNDAEDRAAEFLIEKGMTLITRRYAVRQGEIDLIVLDGDELVFVEVKLRNSSSYFPEVAVGPKKLARLRRAADAYLLEIGNLERPHRFDLVAIDKAGIRHYERVFTSS